MLLLAKLGRGSEGYYLDAVAKGAEDYYVGRGEAPGYWAGRGAELLGLDGEGWWWVTGESHHVV